MRLANASSVVNWKKMWKTRNKGKKERSIIVIAGTFSCHSMTANDTTVAFAWQLYWCCYYFTSRLIPNHPRHRNTFFSVVVFNIHANWHYPSVIFLGCCRGHCYCCCYCLCFIRPANSSLNSFSFAKKNNKYKTHEKRSTANFSDRKK